MKNNFEESPLIRHKAEENAGRDRERFEAMLRGFDRPIWVFHTLYGSFAMNHHAAFTNSSLNSKTL